MSSESESAFKLGKREFASALPALRSELIQLQLSLRQSRRSVFIIVSGADSAGKSEVVHRLHEWLDPRGVQTHALWTLTSDGNAHPPFWRFWRAMPARGEIGIFFGSWYSDLILKRVKRTLEKDAFKQALAHVAFLEKMLAKDGAIFLKFWLDVCENEQKRRLELLETNPETSWRVGRREWKHFRLHDRFQRAYHTVLEMTSTPAAPWHRVPSDDPRYRDLTAGRILVSTLREQLERNSYRSTLVSLRVNPRKGRTNLLDKVDLTKRLDDKSYGRELEEYQSRLGRLAWEAHRKEIALVLVFEGWDAAGKGSAIRRVTQAVDPRLLRVVPVAAPTDEERAHHYLWRFWRQIPEKGVLTIFDRSWYGRVLVERVEGFATASEWQRAYSEITYFEQQLTDAGVVPLKFWIHISKAEQLRRFQERQQTPFKRHKITAEDWRNRRRWAAYEDAVHDMVTRTHRPAAPWILVPGDSKKFARIQILKTACRVLDQELSKRS